MDPNADIDDLTIGDRNALSIAIRITGYGTDYKARVTCPHCDHVNEKVFDLSNLAIKRIGANPVKPGVNLFEFKLPVSKKTVHFKIMTGKDERLKKEYLQSYAHALGDTSIGAVTSHLSFVIQSIDGITDQGKIDKFVNIMPALDAKKLREYISDIQPGMRIVTGKQNLSVK